MYNKHPNGIKCFMGAFPPLIIINGEVKSSFELVGNTRSTKVVCLIGYSHSFFGTLDNIIITLAIEFTTPMILSTLPSWN